jgi:hypothetical protein
MKIIGWGVTALIVFAVIANAGGSSTDSVTDDTTPAGAKVEKAAAKKSDKQGVVGQKVTNAGTSYRVTDVRTTKTLGDQEYGMGEKANGTFVIVGIELTNNKNETKTFMDNSAKIVTTDGSKYESSTEASFELKDDLMLEDIQPDLTTTGHIGYDVPESKLAGAKLVIEDLWGNGEVKVDLGL